MDTQNQSCSEAHKRYGARLWYDCGSSSSVGQIVDRKFTRTSENLHKVDLVRCAFYSNETKCRTAHSFQIHRILCHDSVHIVTFTLLQKPIRFTPCSKKSSRKQPAARQVACGPLTRPD